MFVSYAQNFEDVMLWRALQHVDNGFYLDIGAQDPVIDSVSRGFYEKGWRGVHLEPTPEYAAKLRYNRPDETVIQNAVGDADGMIPFFQFVETGLSTGDPAIAAQHKARGMICLETEVQTLTLNSLFSRFEDREIHWMKIDVEGMEEAVIGSWGDNTARPWIIVVESTTPMSTERADEIWRQQLIDRNYEFCYFDGLNCFFVSKDRLALKKAFNSPPNVFDDFSLSGTATSGILNFVKRKFAEQNRAAEEREAAALRALADKEAQVQALHKEIVLIHRSFSWRVTAPYRLLAETIKRTPRSLQSSLTGRTPLFKPFLRHILDQLVKRIQGSPKLHRLALKGVNSHPSIRLLANRVVGISRGQSFAAQRSTRSSFNPQTISDKELATLSRLGRLYARRLARP